MIRYCNLSDAEVGYGNGLPLPKFSLKIEVKREKDINSNPEYDSDKDQLSRHKLPTELSDENFISMTSMTKR